MECFGDEKAQGKNRKRKRNGSESRSPTGFGAWAEYLYDTSPYSPDDTLIVQTIYHSMSVRLRNTTKYLRCKCYLQCFTSHHHLPPLGSPITTSFIGLYF